MSQVWGPSLNILTLVVTQQHVLLLARASWRQRWRRRRGVVAALVPMLCCAQLQVHMCRSVGTEVGHRALPPSPHHCVLK